MVLHGTREMPEYRKNGPRIYNQDYNRIRNIVSRFHCKRTNCKRISPYFSFPPPIDNFWRVSNFSCLNIFDILMRKTWSEYFIMQNDDRSMKSMFERKLGLLLRETNDVYEKDWLEFLWIYIYIHIYIFLEKIIICYIKKKM